MIKGKIDKQSLWIIGISILILSALGLFYLDKSKEGISLETALPTDQNEEFQLEETDVSDEAKKSAEEKEDIYVHISGEVKNPGVVKLKNGARLYEAVEKAGGITEEGNYDSVNLASVVADQQKVKIGNINDKKGDENFLDDGNVTIQSNNMININSANKSELETLPGIGAAIAQKILEYREENNGFKTIDEIKNVNRIGDKTFEMIKNLISVN
ncbi:MAG TPA: competence protein ComEA [Eubacteriaceae bacterium]|nr:competence protein ComEA [Eubacteriaceae bacterium]